MADKFIFFLIWSDWGTKNTNTKKNAKVNSSGNARTSLEWRDPSYTSTWQLNVLLFSIQTQEYRRAALMVENFYECKPLA